MDRKRMLLPALASALMLGLGLLSGLAVAGTTAKGPGGKVKGPPPAATTSAPADTAPADSAPADTAPADTAPATTPSADPPADSLASMEAAEAPTTTDTTAPTTTVTGTTTQPPIVQTTTETAPTTTVVTPTTTQANPGSTTVGASTTPTDSTPTAPCDTTQLTCGNNASTQVAVVSQVCSASSANSVITLNIETLAGTPVNNVTLSPTTTCLNQLQITQIVEQYCVGCTVIVIPPPPPTPPVIYVPEPVAVPGASPPPQQVMAYCMPQPILRPDGTVGTLLYLDLGQPEHDSRYGAATPAIYTPGVGMTCPTGSGGSGGTGGSPSVPRFTLTVPASFVGQYVSLCIQSAKPSAPPVCHSIRIDTGATISIPVTTNVVAKVIKAKLVKKDKPKPKKQIAKASKAYSASFQPAKSTRSTVKSGTAKSAKHVRKHVTTTRKVDHK